MNALAKKTDYNNARKKEKLVNVLLSENKENYIVYTNKENAEYIRKCGQIKISSDKKNAGCIYSDILCIEGNKVLGFDDTGTCRGQYLEQDIFFIFRSGHILDRIDGIVIGPWKFLNNTQIVYRSVAMHGPSTYSLYDLATPSNFADYDELNCKEGKKDCPAWIDDIRGYEH